MTELFSLVFIVIVCIHFLHLFVFQPSFFIGINRSTSDGTFVYTESASPIKFEAWGANEPNNFNGNENCVILNVETGEWNDVNCDNSMKFICEYKHTRKN